MKWYKEKPEVANDLCSSGVENFSLKNMNIRVEELDLTGENFYGYIPLLRAIGAKYRIPLENIVLTSGTSLAIFLACTAILEEGVEVLIEKPAYEPLLSAPRTLGVKIKRFERKFQNNYQISLDEFQSSLSEKTKMVILSNLHNPSGVLLNPPTFHELKSICKKRGITIFVDEVYLDFIDGENGQTSFSADEGILAAASLTKVYGLSGLRCGWILTPSSLQKKMRSIIDHTTVEGVYIGEVIATEAFKLLESIKKKNESRIKKNKAMIKDFISGEKNLSWVEPSGGVVCFPRIETGLSGDLFAEALLKEYDTAVVPGRFFEEPKHFRLGYGIPSDILERSLENISRVLRKYQ
jgi:aspartate/methionine/tyrosine aminotransferase